LNILHKQGASTRQSIDFNLVNISDIILDINIVLKTYLTFYPKRKPDLSFIVQFCQFIWIVLIVNCGCALAKILELEGNVCWALYFIMNFLETLVNYIK